jgi:hypothetical protein
MTYFGPEVIGATPAKIKWNVVRGDTAKLRIEFLENDESTYFDTSDWTFVSSAYEMRDEIIDPLDVVVGDGYVDIVVSPDISKEWGLGYNGLVGELAFDLQVTLPDNSIWTAVVGTISVIGDVTGSL